MKSVTEFPTHLLLAGIKAKTALAAEGKTPEEIQASLGTTFKFEGDKLKYFSNALDVANQNLEGLYRLLVVKFNEGEAVPPKAMQVEDVHYLPETQMDIKAKTAPKPVQKGGRGGKGGRSSGPKESPWGLSPEQKAAKKSSAANKAN